MRRSRVYKCGLNIFSSTGFLFSDLQFTELCTSVAVSASMMASDLLITAALIYGKAKDLPSLFLVVLFFLSISFGCVYFEL